MEENGSPYPGVAYICHEFPKFTETFVYNEVKGLMELGLNLRVFAMKGSATPEQIEEFEGLVSVTSYFPADLSADFIKAQAKWILKKPLKYLKELFTVIAAGRKRTALSPASRVALFMRGAVLASILEARPEFRVMHDPGTGHELISVHTAHLFTGIPYGFTVHAPLELYLESPLLAQDARDAKWIAPINMDARERLIKLAGEQIREKCRIVHMGVNIGDYLQTREPVKGKIVGVGSLIDRKGPDLIIRALPLLLERGMDVSLDLAGSGPMHEKLLVMARDLDVVNRVNLLGGCHPARVRDLLSVAEVFVQPCRIDNNGARDGTPVALMEAMAMGLPSVSTDVSGIPELIEDGVTGLLVEQDDVVALADAIERVLTDTDFANRIAEAGRTKVGQHFNLQGQYERLHELILSKS